MHKFGRGVPKEMMGRDFAEIYLMNFNEVSILYLKKINNDPSNTEITDGTGNTLVSQKEGFQTTKQCLLQNLVYQASMF